MTYPADPADIREQTMLDHLRAGREALDQGHGQLRAAVDAIQAGHLTLIAYLSDLRERYASLYAENQRLSRENRRLRGDHDPDDTAPLELADLPKFGRRAPRLGRRRRAAPPGIPAHSHRKPNHRPEARA